MYRERPFLYNKGHNDFKNKLIKDNAWNEISKIMRDKNYGKLQILFFTQYFLLHLIINLYKYNDGLKYQNLSGNFYTSEYCQTRCTSLRNQYNREKRILNSQYKSGSAASTHKPFAFYSQLSFLDNYVRKRRFIIIIAQKLLF